MRKFLFLFLLPGILLTACDEDDPEPAPFPIVGTWQVIKVENRLPGEAWQDSNEPCRLDNTEVYASDGKWTQYDGTNQCGAGTGIFEGTWAMAASNTRVVYTYSGISGNYESTVESLTDNSMILTNSTGQLDGEQTRTTYKKL